MTRTSGAPGKGNPGGERGGNRSETAPTKKTATPRSGAGPRSGHQAKGADPHRGQPG